MPAPANMRILFPSTEQASNACNESVHVIVAHILGCRLTALEANGLHKLVCLGLLVELRRRIALLQTPLTSIHLNWLTTNGVGDDDGEC